MQNDTISRSALITDLENRKVTAGDPVIKFLFDRLIDIVKDQPGVEEAPPAAQGPTERMCCECRNYENSVQEEPCLHCWVPRNWEARDGEE